MIKQLAFFSAVLAFATACSSSNGGSGSGGSGSASGPSGSGSGTATGGGTGTGTGVGTGGGGTGGGSDGKTVTLTMEDFEVAPGAEVYKCQNFANPFHGDEDISAFESHMTIGSHHLLLFYKDGAEDGSLEDCSGLEFAPTPYSTQIPDDEVAFPPGVAARLPTTSGIRLQSHYLNTTPDPIKAHVVVTFHLADPSTVTSYAGVLFVIQPNIDIPPNSTQNVTYDCNLPMDMNIMKVGSHMHEHGTAFTSTIAGQELYDTMTWNEPKPEFFAPPRVAHQGDPLHFQCTFQNDGPTTLTFGESAQTNEMCILVSSFYPVPDGTVTVGCQ